jgi:hypothetical protein
MRDKLNENPVAQIALVALLVIAVGYLLMSNMGGSEEGGGGESPAVSVEAPSPSETSTTGEGEGEAVGSTPEIAAATSSISAPTSHPLPHRVDVAYRKDETIALLLVRDGGIEDHIVRKASKALESMHDVAFFSAKAKHVARFAALTGPLGVDRVPALIVVRPKRFNGAGPAPASVTYGLQDGTSVSQAIRDAVYKGPELTYAPK